MSQMSQPNEPKAKQYVISMRLRKKVEMLFAHLKRILGLGLIRLRGGCGANEEFLLTAWSHPDAARANSIVAVTSSARMFMQSFQQMMQRLSFPRSPASIRLLTQS
jgi:hypothetical protein